MVPASGARQTSSCTNKIDAVGKVVWLTKSTRVHLVTPDQIASTIRSADPTGNGWRM
jgi:hypothetical protein